MKNEIPLITNQYLKRTVDIQTYTELNLRISESIPEGHLFC